MKKGVKIFLGIIFVVIVLVILFSFGNKNISKEVSKEIPTRPPSCENTNESFCQGDICVLLLGIETIHEEVGEISLVSFSPAFDSFKISFEEETTPDFAVGGFQKIGDWDIQIKEAVIQKFNGGIICAVVELKENPFSPEETCVDVDGLNYGVQGYAYSKDCLTKNTARDCALWDSCISDTSLEEYVCDEGYPKSITHECPNGCKSGACLE